MGVLALSKLLKMSLLFPLPFEFLQCKHLRVAEDTQILKLFKILFLLFKGKWAFKTPRPLLWSHYCFSSLTEKLLTQWNWPPCGVYCITLVFKVQWLLGCFHFSACPHSAFKLFRIWKSVLNYKSKNDHVIH